MNLIQSQTGCNCLANLLLVTGQHDGPSDAYLLKVTDGFICLFLDCIRNHDGTFKHTVLRHINHGADARALLVVHLHFLHQLTVSCQDHMTVYDCLNPMTGNLLRVRHPVHVNGAAPGILD